MTKVVVRNGNVESALRTFKQKNIKALYAIPYKCIYNLCGWGL